jgi:hypothetical protein
MASATGIPENVHAVSEEEPLLGSAGGVQQRQTEPIYHNFITGKCQLKNEGYIRLADCPLQEALLSPRLACGW